MKKSLFNRQPKIMSAHNGIITSVLRHHDKAILSIGDNTLSGGKILSIKADTKTIGNMYAEIGRPGRCTAIACIVLS